MAAEDRFKQAVIALLAKRAANQCSNPDCRAITSGPADDLKKSVNVGEAAHIYGAQEGSARYDPSMLSSARSDIANGIWLCGNCHKLIDDDEIRYPAGLLFEWQRSHELYIAKLVGKPGAQARRRYEERHLHEFGSLSYLAERLLLGKDPGWEYRLTSEMLRYETGPVIRRWQALKKGLYFKRGEQFRGVDASHWLARMTGEMHHISHAFSGLVNEEFMRAWGPPGVRGDEHAIVDASRLFAEMLQGCIDWEERIRFAVVDDFIEEARQLHIGIAGRIIEEAEKLPLFLERILSDVSASGVQSLHLTLDLPAGWNESLDAALARALEKYQEAQ